MKKLLSVDHPAQAHFYQGLLASEGIEAVVQGEALFSAQGVLPVFGAGEASVWLLDEGDEAQALIVVAAMTAKKPEGKTKLAACWRCPRCNEMLEPQFTACWRCVE